MRHTFRVTSRIILATATTAGVGCDFVSRYITESPADRLVAAALRHWATHGEPFLEGTTGTDTVASISATGARSWEVAVVPTSGGSPTVWSLEIRRAEVYPVFPGEEFVGWLETGARALGLRTFIPSDVAAEMRAGEIRAVGDLEVRYGPAHRSGRNTDERIAYLAPAAVGERTEWRIQQDVRSARVLLEALKRVTNEMLLSDDRVLSCMGSASPASVPRDVQLACVRDVLEEQFGPG